MSVPTAVRALLALLFFAFPALCQDEAKVLAAFGKTFTPPPKGKAKVADKLAALATTSGLDSGNTADALVAAFENVGTELAALDAERDALNAEMAKLIAGQEMSGNRTLQTDAHKRYNEIKPRAVELRQRCDELRELQAKLCERVATLRARDSALWLLQRIVGSKKHALQLKLAAARPSAAPPPT